MGDEWLISVVAYKVDKYRNILLFNDIIHSPQNMPFPISRWRIFSWNCHHTERFYYIQIYSSMLKITLHEYFLFNTVLCDMIYMLCLCLCVGTVWSNNLEVYFTIPISQVQTHYRITGLKFFGFISCLRLPNTLWVKFGKQKLYRISSTRLHLNLKGTAMSYIVTCQLSLSVVTCWWHNILTLFSCMNNWNHSFVWWRSTTIYIILMSTFSCLHGLYKFYIHESMCVFICTYICNQFLPSFHLLTKFHSQEIDQLPHSCDVNILTT